METLITYANQFVIYTVCYALFFAIYGFVIYNLLKFIFRVAANAYKLIKSDSATSWTFAGVASTV